MDPPYRLAAMAAAWLLWLTPFFRARRHKRRAPETLDRRARRGILCQALAFMVAFSHSPALWNSPLSPLRFAATCVLAGIAAALSWTAVPNLGKQWRVDAALNDDHELITTGPYRIVRHPIYTSMFFMLLAGIALTCGFISALAAICLFTVGVEIRVRVEDQLLESRFGSRFTQWQRSHRAWLPLLR